MISLEKLNLELKRLTKGKVIDIGNLNGPEAFAFKDIFEEKYSIIGPFEDKYNPGKYALGFQIKYSENRRN